MSIYQTERPSNRSKTPLYGQALKSANGQDKRESQKKVITNLIAYETPNKRRPAKRIEKQEYARQKSVRNGRKYLHKLKMLNVICHVPVRSVMLLDGLCVLA